MLSRSFDNLLYKHTKAIFVILCCCFFFLSCHDDTSNPPFSVTNQKLDSNLQKCINEAKKALADPSLPLTSLHCPGANIEDLAGLETLTSLEVVDFSNNKIRSISPIFNLLDQTISYDNTGRPSTKPVLTSINLSNNQISDANKILTFSQPIDIDLSGNPLRNLPYPENIRAIPKNSENIIRWQAIPQALSYNIYFKQNSQAEAAQTMVTQWRDSRYVHTALTNGTPYFYQVSANFAAGESRISPIVNATPAIANATPLPPENVSLVAVAADQIMIDWEEAPHATSYTLRSAITGNFPDITNILPPFRHSELLPETTYWYKLVSLNELGESLVTKEYSATTLKQTDIQPSNIIQFNATPEDGQVTLSWEVVTEPQSLYFSLEPYNDITTIKQSATLLSQDTPPWVHKELTNNINYYYYLVSGTSSDTATFQRQTTKPNRLLANLSFGDSNLSQCISDSGYSAVAELQTLHCANYDIHSLDGIESLTALQELMLGHNAISDIQPIHSLTNLNKLSLYDNQISDITGIDKLQQLKNLELRSNQIDDLSPLTTLNNLIALGISDNHIVNLSPLSNLSNLENLDISNNSINNIAVFTQLGKLKRLNISQNRITSVTALAGLKQLVYLDISSNSINDFTPLNNLPLLNFSNIIGNSDTPPAFTVGGSITGLTGSGLILQLENSDQLPITKNGHFNFPSTFPSGNSYRVTIIEQPQQPAQNCLISNDSGVIENTDIDTVNVACETLSYNANVSASGLFGSGFEVQLGEQKLPIANDGTHQFPTPLLDGSDIQLSINQQPKQPLQICTINDDATRIQSADVNFSINCTTEQFQLRGNITGLQGKGLLLQNNNANDLAIDNDGNFAFSGLFDDNSAYQISIKKQPTNPSQTCSIENGSGIINSGPVSSISIHCEINRFNVGGTITGLLGTGLVLQNNANDDLNIDSDGSFHFPTPILDLNDYHVTVKQHPSTPSQTCTISAGSGNLQGTDISSIVVNCDPNKFTIGGTVQGLQGQGLVLQNQGANDLEVSAEGNFTFANPITDQDSYAISVLKNPTNPVQTCEVSQNQSGQTQGRNVTAIQVSCTTEKFTIGGQITGLLGSGLIITNNNQDNLAIDKDGEFQFSTAIFDHENYALSVLKNPVNPVQTCTVSSNGIGQINGSHLRDIAITCATEKFKVGGRVIGLMGKGLVLTNNESDHLTLDSDGEFQFTTPITDSDSYQVSVTGQPSQPNQTCNVSGGNGIISGSATNAVVINCDTESYTVGGVLNGLLGSGLELQLNNEYTLTINRGSNFTFTPAIPDASEYQITILTQPSNLNQTCTINNGTGTIQGDNIATAEVNCQTNSYLISGTVTHLAGSGLILQNNGADNLTIEKDGNFTFTNKIEDGKLYQVTVLQQPNQLTQTCTVTNEQASGAVQGADISHVEVHCQTNNYSVGGSVTGLAGTGLTLTSSTGDTLNINNNGEFTFDTLLLDGSDYQITVSQQPTALSQICTATNAEGTIQGASINNITIGCQTNSYLVGGNVTGLAGSGLTLTSSTGDTLPINNDGDFIFETSLLDGSDYLVSVSQQPTALSQTCTATNNEGKLQGADITNVTINCQTNSYSVGGSVTGLAGTGLTLTSSTGDTLSINDNGEFTFDTLLLDGSNYQISVSQQPNTLSQTCTATNGEGDIQGANINNITINCQTNTFSIGGTISGLTGSGLILQINTADDLSLSADGEFIFSTALADGSDYTISVNNQPTEPNQTCSLSNPTGRIDGADITDISLTCEDNNFITNVQFTPASPMSLSLDQKVFVTFDYETVHADGVRIWSKPYAAGLVLPGLSYQAFPPLKSMGTGQGESFFEVTSDVGIIDEVRMEMRAENTNIVLRELTIPVNYAVVASSHKITNIGVSINSPATLSYGTPITVSYDYSTNNTNGVVISVVPLSDSSLSPRQETDPSILPTGNGSSTSTFTILSGPTEVHIDQIRLQMVTGQNFELAVKFVPVDFTFQQAEPLSPTTNSFLWNIRLLPATPRNMTNNEPIRLDFDYDTIVPEGILVMVQPVSAEAPNLASHDCGADSYPVGTGSGTCLITINPTIDMTIDALHLTMMTEDQRVILYETSITTAYTYSQDQETNVKRPAIRTKNQANNHLALSNTETPPLTIYPLDGARNVFLNTMIAIKPNTLQNFLSLTLNDITLSDTINTLPGRIAFKDGMITFTPANPLTSATNYTVTVNPTGRHISSPYVSHFTTALLPSAQYTVAPSMQDASSPQTTSTPILTLIANEKEAILEYELSALPNELSQASINFTLTTTPSDQPTLFSIFAFGINHDTRSEPTLLSSFSKLANLSLRTSYSFPITQVINKAKAQGDKAIGFQFAMIEGKDNVVIENSQPNKIPATMPYIRYFP